MPRVKKCPNGTRRKPRKTGVCLKYDGKKKFSRCKDGERKNKKTRKCEKYTRTNPKWKRCPNGSRRTRTGGCKQYDKKDNDAKTQETIRYLNQEIKKLKKMVKQKRKTLKKTIVPVVKSPESSNEPIPESSNESIPETQTERLPELPNFANVPFRARL